MKGEIPVSYIVAIVLAIAVLALLGYWFYMSGWKFGTSVSKQECQSLKLKFCLWWSSQGYKPDNPTATWNAYEGGKGGACAVHDVKVTGKSDC